MSPMDMSGIGNVASASKRATQGGSKTLSSFTVRRGDNGGIVVSETYENKAPAGRRSSASFPDRMESKENPFGPNDGAKAQTHVTDLLVQMGAGEAESPAEDDAEGMIEEPGSRPAAAARVSGPAGGSVSAARIPLRAPSGPYGG